MAPAGLPAGIADKIHSDVARVVQSSEIVKWAKVVKASEARAE